MNSQLIKNEDDAVQFVNWTNKCYNTFGLKQVLFPSLIVYKTEDNDNGKDWLYYEVFHLDRLKEILTELGG